MRRSEYRAKARARLSVDVPTGLLASPTHRIAHRNRLSDLRLRGFGDTLPAMQRQTETPLFFVGMPRSGTTVIFQSMSAHPELSWFSQLHDRWPGRRSVALWSRTADLGLAFRRSVPQSTQKFRRLERLKVGPSEAYGLWERCCGPKFTNSFLLGENATEAEATCLRDTVSTVMRLQGKPRFATKITGPARIHYLAGVFPRAKFVHITRDPRAVVRSLMNVPFWRETSRKLSPAWTGGLTPTDMEEWKRYGETAVALAALQWRAVIQTARAESRELGAEQFLEIRYEDFLTDHTGTLKALVEFGALAPSTRPQEFLRKRFPLRDMNTQWREEMPADEADVIREITSPLLASLRYA